MWKDLFSFSRRERNGIFVILFLIIVIYSATKLFSFFAEEEIYDYSEYETQILEFEESLIRKPISSTNNEKFNPFKFNPNTISIDSLELFGFNKKVVKTINNYRKKSGKFYKKEDFKKIYGISSIQYEFLKSYIEIPQKKQYHTSENKKTVVEKSDSLFYFDPNTIDYQNLMKLGFSDKVAKTYLKYRTSGGKFYKKEDLKKIYGITDNFFAKLKPYIHFIDTTQINQKNKEYNESQLSRKIIEVELNSADSANLESLNGIGKILSVRILKYRDMLGGFYETDQLKEVYGITEATYIRLKTKIFVDTSLIKLININFASKAELEKHPYLNYKDAKSIIKFRAKNGSFKNIHVLREKTVVSENTFEKLRHYLAIE